MKKRVKVKVFTPKKKSRLKFYLINALLVVILSALSFWMVFELIGQRAAENWIEAKSSAANGGQINLPKDDAPHTDANSEFWLYQGRLLSETGKHYNFYYLTFVTSDSKTQAVSYVSIDDLQSAQHYVDQFRNEMNPGFGVDDHFYFSTTDRVMQGGDGADHLKIKNKEFAFDLSLKSKEMPIFHGKNGLIDLGNNESSYYYSRSRMKVTGSVSIGHKAETVSGIAWFDHQWGDFSLKSLTWDWFGLQLADGTDMMIYQVKDLNNKIIATNGSITREGVTELMAASDIKLNPTEQWLSPKTNAEFATVWQLQIPNKRLDLTLRSIMKNSEFNFKSNFAPGYWAGAVEVNGTLIGQGFMSLSGKRK